jgi:molybdopterin-synthase adenylyltransferase
VVLSNRKAEGVNRTEDIPSYEEIFQRNFGVYTPEEQQRLREGAVAIAGLGCVGGMVAVILARTGVGTLTLIDHDVYEPANFNRQPFALLSSLGLPKVVAAGRYLHDMNPHVSLDLQNCRLSENNLQRLIRDSDVVIQGMDHVPSRIVLHDGAARMGIPVITMSGQPPFRGLVSSFLPGGPSYQRVMSLPEKVDWNANESIRNERAAHARPRACPGWYEAFTQGKCGWGVTAERVYLMATLQASEAIRVLVGRAVRAPAPKAYIIDLDDPEYPVRLAMPVGGAWDYREF